MSTWLLNAKRHDGWVSGEDDEVGSMWDSLELVDWLAGQFHCRNLGICARDVYRLAALLPYPHNVHSIADSCDESKALYSTA